MPKPKDKLKKIKNIIWIVAGIMTIVSTIVLIYVLLNLQATLSGAINIPF